MSETNDQRRYYERMIDEIGAEYRSHIDELQADNAKLRELVRDMATHLAYADRVVDGGVFDARLRREVAELGVEVDG